MVGIALRGKKTYHILYKIIQKGLHLQNKHHNHKGLPPQCSINGIIRVERESHCRDIGPGSQVSNKRFTNQQGNMT
jgi:hypothetical protein